MYKQVSVPYTMSEVSSNVAVSTKCAKYPKMDDSQSCSCQMDPRMDIVEMHENLVHSPNSPFIPPPFPSFSTDFPAVLRLDSPCTGTDRRCTGAGTFGTVAWSRCSGHRHRRPLFFQLRLERLGVTLSGRGTTHGFAGFFAQRCPTTAGTRRRFLTLRKNSHGPKKWVSDRGPWNFILDWEDTLAILIDF